MALGSEHWHCLVNLCFAYPANGRRLIKAVRHCLNAFHVAQVPEVRAKLDSREFEVLTDVITWAQVIAWIWVLCAV